MYSIPLFYIFFCVLAISSIWIIVMRWKRYMKYSNGTYKNAGQNLIFKTELSQNEIIRKLETPNQVYWNFANISTVGILTV